MFLHCKVSLIFILFLGSLGVEMVQTTPLRRTSPYALVAVNPQSHAGSKTLLQQNPPVVNWGHLLTPVVPYDGRRTVVLVGSHFAS